MYIHPRKGNSIGDSAITVLSRSLMVNTTLTDLKLDSRPLITRHLWSIHALAFLHSSIQQITGFVIWGMYHWVKHWKQMQHSRNLIWMVNTQRTYKCCPPQKHLHHESIDNNICDGGAKSFAEALKTNTTLTELYLDSEHKKETRSQQSTNKSLTFIHIILTANNIWDSGAKSLGESLKVNTTLIKLFLRGNNDSSQMTGPLPLMPNQ